VREFCNFNFGVERIASTSIGCFGEVQLNRNTDVRFGFWFNVCSLLLTRFRAFFGAADVVESPKID
jgi:hypothetical protein